MARYIYQAYAKDTGGDVISSMTISVYEGGTDTAANIYAASSGGSAVSAVTSDSSTGYFKFYVDDGDYNRNQKFKIVGSKSGYDDITLDDIVIFPETEWVYYASASATDQGVDSDDNSIADLLAEIGTSTKRAIVLKPGTYTYSTNDTITSNITLILQPGAVLSIDSGVTVTINAKLQAGPYQIFSGSGTVSFGSGAVTEIYPEWWGADVTDSSEDSTYVNAALTAANGYGDVILSSGTWTLDDVTISANLYGRHGTVVNQANAANDVFTATGDVDVAGFKVNMLSGSTKAAFNLTTPSGHNQHGSFRNVPIDGDAAGGGTAVGFLLSASGTYGIDDLEITDIYGRDLLSIIKFSTADTGFINGNNFKRIWGYNCTYVIDCNDETSANSNMFDTVRGQYNAGIPMTAVIGNLAGQRNTLVGCDAYDGGKVVNLTKDSYNNLIISPMTLYSNPANYIEDLGIMNEFVFPNRDYIFANFHESFVGAALTSRWNTSTSGTGSVAIADNLTYGGVLLSTGATTGGTAQLDFNGKAPWSGNSKSRVMWRAKISNTSDITVEMGIQVAGVSTKTICFRYSGSGNWTAVTDANDGTESTADSGEAPDTSQHVFTIQKLSTSTVEFAIDGANVAEITSNIFSYHFEPYFYITNGADADKTLHLSNFDVRLY